MTTIYLLCVNNILLQRFFCVKGKILRMFYVVILMISVRILCLFFQQLLIQ